MRMNKLLQTYMDYKAKVFRYFDCEEDYYIRICTDYKWQLLPGEGVTFFAYWLPGHAPTQAVVVSKSGVPIVYRTKDLTMIIAIDCIKMAFIMNNTDELPAVPITEVIK